MVRLLSLLLFTGLVLSKGTTTTVQASEQTKMKFHDGDIILRDGKGLISAMMRNTSSVDRKYSHAGIILNGPSGPFVVHCIGTPEGRNAVKIESLMAFTDPVYNSSWSVYRYHLSPTEQKALKSALHVQYKKGLRFDDAFDLTTDSAMYCTEFIYKSYAAAIGHTPPFGVTHTSVGSYIGLDDLYHNKNCFNIVETQTSK